MKEHTIVTYSLICLSVIVSVVGQIVIKLGVESVISSEGISNVILSILAHSIQSPLVLFGLFLYGVGAVAWILVLSRVDLSFAYPFLALNFILITVSSRVLLSETVPLLRWLGVLIICVGVLIVALSARAG
jgi:drug/metabolite transporter (DMT)-like permease